MTFTEKQVRLRVIHEGRTARWEVTEICMKFASRAVPFKIEPQNSIRFKCRSRSCSLGHISVLMIAGTEMAKQREDSLFPLFARF